VGGREEGSGRERGGEWEGERREVGGREEGSGEREGRRGQTNLLRGSGDGRLAQVPL